MGLAMSLIFVLTVAVTAVPVERYIADDLLRVQVLADKPLPNERAFASRQPFYAQSVTVDGDLEFENREQEKVIRRKYDMDMSAPFALTEWVGIPVAGGDLGHRGWLYCVARSRFGTEKCFQDSDGDGKFDRLTNLDPDKRDRFLQFQAIEPISYRYKARERKVAESGMYRQPEISISYALEGEQLKFSTLAYVGLMRWANIDNAVFADLRNLPTTVEVAGARIRIVSWDGKRARLALETSMTQSPIRLIAPETYRPISLSNSRGWRLETVSAPLPGR